jgi:hypothetical protein
MVRYLVAESTTEPMHPWLVIDLEPGIGDPARVIAQASSKRRAEEIVEALNASFVGPLVGNLDDQPAPIPGAGL